MITLITIISEAFNDSMAIVIKPVFAQGPIRGSDSLSQYYGFGNIPDLGELFFRLRDPLLNIAALALFLYIVFGAFRFLTSGGDKEAVESGRRMITHGIIGALLLMLTFVILKLIPEILGIGVKIIP